MQRDRRSSSPSSRKARTGSSGQCHGNLRAGVAFTGGPQAALQTEPVQHSGPEPGRPTAAPRWVAFFLDLLAFLLLLAVLLWGPVLLEGL